VVFVGSPQFDPRLGEPYANAVFKKFIQCAASHCAPQIRVCAILGSPDAGDAFQSVLNFLIDAPSVTGQVITVHREYEYKGRFSLGRVVAVGSGM
jgi:hypothetical protein